MYGGASSKLGRGAPNRRHSSFPPPPPNRPSAPAGRLSMGASSRNAAKETAAPAAEETFRLTSGSNSLAFSMIIRLAPDLVEEIRRVEAQGGTARMKFGPNPHNPIGNVKLLTQFRSQIFDWFLPTLRKVLCVKSNI
uniref:Uncharacterized protein n=1 Tax=Cajanus cajan TaxID=3821 RepID=A0A151SGY2_CAJCA|nr:hypothetical protein KK1_000263 [Cajanus cajan]